jgi:two-component system response regulator AtoC
VPCSDVHSGRRKEHSAEIMSENVLVIDDEPNMRHMMTVVLEKAGYTVTVAQDGLEALSFMEGTHFDLILCDLRMPKMDGLAFLKQVAEGGLDTVVIMMSAYGTIDTAVEAMKLGAADYISKPFKPDEILLKVGQVQERNRLREENLRLRDEVVEKFSFHNIVAKSKAMGKIFDTIRKIADYKTTVLISGESGSGKELIARAIHYNGERKLKPIVAVNCGALPENLLESELFGHIKGAFTDATKDKKGLFQEANGGTLFLDEIAALPLSLQVKLLRVLQDEMVRPVGGTQPSKVDVRIIAATAVNLAEAVKEGSFREDLYYRINVLLIDVPALRQRKEDVPLLLNHFVERFNRRLGKDIKGIRPEAMQVLINYPWPGNVRELENVIERTMVLTEQTEIHVEELPEEIKGAQAVVHDTWTSRSMSIKANTVVMEKILIQKALEETKNNRTRAAKILGISHPTLLSKMKTYGIS